jgi:hypothetical protein
VNVVTAGSAARYTGNPLMRPRWILLFYLAGMVTTAYLFILPMWVLSLSLLWCWCRCRLSGCRCYGAGAGLGMPHKPATVGLTRPPLPTCLPPPAAGC